LGILTEPEYQIVFVDTPGIHKPLHRLGEHMVKVARSAISDADVVVWLVDVSVAPTDEDREIARVLKAARDVPVILALNKVDLVPAQAADNKTLAYLALVDVERPLLISAERGDNRERLLEVIVQALPFGPRYFPVEQVTDQDERFLAAELIREQVLRQLRQEVPHALAVVIDEFKDRGENLSYISATIVVERDSQKQIVIGRGGAMLKQIGQAARVEIEQALGRRVYLEMWVKVVPKWRRDPEQLRRMGYSVPGEGAG